MQKGNIGVTTENIFPVIKKFLYSDHEIFLREMVSNAVDATQKLKTLAQQGEFKGELGDLTVRVNFDADKGTITISDHGIGMTEEEIDKYINQIAFSGVTDFLEKYKDNANNIIGPDCFLGRDRLPREVQGQRQQHHRPLRTGLLLFVHGIEEGGDHHQELQRGFEGREVELRRKSCLRD